MLAFLKRNCVSIKRHSVSLNRNSVTLLCLAALFVTGMSASELLGFGPRTSDAVRRPSASSGQGSVKSSDPKGNSKTDKPASKTTVKEQAEEQNDPSLPSLGGIELKTSRVYVFVGKTGLGHEHAVIGMLKSGELHFGREKDAGKLEFDMRSFIADTPQARQYVGLKGETDRATQQKVNNNMLGPDVLNVGSFPTATFEVTSIKKQRELKDGTVEYLLEGDFTLRGVARKIRFTATDEPKKGWHHLRGRFPIRQSDFGITPFSTALGTIGVANELTIFGDLWVRPEQPLAEKPEEPAR